MILNFKKNNRGNGFIAFDDGSIYFPYWNSNIKQEGKYIISKVMPSKKRNIFNCDGMLISEYRNKNIIHSIGEYSFIYQENNKLFLRGYSNSKKIIYDIPIKKYDIKCETLFCEFYSIPEIASGEYHILDNFFLFEVNEFFNSLEIEHKSNTYLKFKRVERYNGEIISEENNKYYWNNKFNNKKVFFDNIEKCKSDITNTIDYYIRKEQVAINNIIEKNKHIAINYLEMDSCIYYDDNEKKRQLAKDLNKKIEVEEIEDEKEIEKIKKYFIDLKIEKNVLIDKAILNKILNKIIDIQNFDCKCWKMKDENIIIDLFYYDYTGMGCKNEPVYNYILIDNQNKILDIALSKVDRIPSEWYGNETNFFINVDEKSQTYIWEINNNNFNVYGKNNHFNLKGKGGSSPSFWDRSL